MSQSSDTMTLALGHEFTKCKNVKKKVSRSLRNHRPLIRKRLLTDSKEYLAEAFDTAFRKRLQKSIFCASHFVKKLITEWMDRK